jgi:hypothetical protein
MDLRIERRKNMANSLTGMIKLIGYKGQTYECAPGWIVCDENGRSGKLVHAELDAQLGVHTLTVDPGYGVMIELMEPQVSFVYPPEEENA